MYLLRFIKIVTFLMAVGVNATHFRMTPKTLKKLLASASSDDSPSHSREKARARLRISFQERDMMIWRD